VGFLIISTPNVKELHLPKIKYALTENTRTDVSKLTDENVLVGRHCIVDADCEGTEHI
jgi:hypothetical protein